MNNNNSTQPFTDAAAYITHPLLAQRIQGLTALDFEDATIATPAARVRYIMILLEQCQLSRSSCVVRLMNTSAPTEHEADHLEAILQFALNYFQSQKSCFVDRQRLAFGGVNDLACRKGRLLENKESTRAHGVALLKIAADARQRLLDMKYKWAEVEGTRPNTGPEREAR